VEPAAGRPYLLCLRYAVGDMLVTLYDGYCCAVQCQFSHEPFTRPCGGFYMYTFMVAATLRCVHRSAKSGSVV
jgi:hypothetical protein